MKHLKEASEFFNQQYIDNLLDKINQSGITSLSDIERNQLTLFSEDDKEIISTIEKMGDITYQFKILNKKMNQMSSSGENARPLMKDWMMLNDKLKVLERTFKKWGIEHGDWRLSKMMSKVRPDVYGYQIEL